MTTVICRGSAVSVAEVGAVGAVGSVDWVVADVLGEEGVASTGGEPVDGEFGLASESPWMVQPAASSTPAATSSARRYS
ncbi:MAG TPA: hypothetical protein VH419_14905, partial [Nocardioidaceae bacterium]